MTKFKIEFIKSDNVLHCDTLEKAKVFEKFLKDKLNFNYNIEKRYSCNGKNTCYCLTGKTNILNYSPLNYWKQHRFEVLEFDDYDWR